jgi:hypothetical protein
MMAIKVLVTDVMQNEKLNLIGNDREEAPHLQVNERLVMSRVVPNVKIVTLKNVASEQKAIVC